MRKTWSVTEVSQATGLSEGTIKGYLSQIGMSAKGGLSMHIITGLLEHPKRDTGKNDKDKVAELADMLNRCGYYTPYTSPYESDAMEYEETQND